MAFLIGSSLKKATVRQMERF